jgi:hypothetical protein
MGVGISLFLFAVGAVLTFAVTVPATGIDLDVVGVILMGVGFGVLLYTLIWWSDAMPWRRSRTVIRERYVESPYTQPTLHEGYGAGPVVRERRVIDYEERAS